jgi:accessory colonization factor AcfC
MQSKSPSRATHIHDNNIKKNIETFIGASKAVGLEVNAEKSKYMLLCFHHNAGQTHDIKSANRCSENVAQFRYMGITITNQNLIQGEFRGN